MALSCRNTCAQREPTRAPSRTLPSPSTTSRRWSRTHRCPSWQRASFAADDAERLVYSGIKGVIVSNHGGRQLDGVITTAEAVREVVACCEGRAEVYVDSGLRSGIDVFRALVRARAVFVGRPIVWGLAAVGAGGVRDVLDGFGHSLRETMMLAGTATLAEITEDFIVPGR